MAPKLSLTALAAVLPLVVAQQIGTNTPEVHPSLPTWKCTTSGGCVQQNTSIVLDSNYRWLHTVGGYQSCTTSSGLNQTLCPNEAACAANCAIEGADYATSGITTSGDSLTLTQYVTSGGTTTNASPRVYLLGPDGDYEMLQLLGQELRYDVDVSTLVCGENGALYLSQMDASGGRSANNPGGANYGSGYCDAQCPVETWINGTLNTSNQRYCCNEMDIWEANSEATALTPHPCSATSCDGGGCGFNPYAQGVHGYYGPGLTVNTLKPFTVITQFITNDGTTTGTITEIRRSYIQNGVTIPNAVTSSGMNSITASWCSSSDSAAANLGGLNTIGKALGSGMVLIFSIWNDNSQYMNWLDSGNSGPCSSSAGNPSLIQSQNPGTYVTFSNIRWGDIGSTGDSPGTGPSSSSSSTSTPPPTSTSTSTPTTTTSNPSSTGCVPSPTVTVTATVTVNLGSTTTSKPTSSPPTSTTSPSGQTQVHWGQCGGIGWKGPTVCASPYTCQVSNPYYSQCL